MSCRILFDIFSKKYQKWHNYFEGKSSPNQNHLPTPFTHFIIYIYIYLFIYLFIYLSIYLLF
jgi:hypothetical protein